MAWSRVKAWLRAKSPPTLLLLVNAIGKALLAITPDDCFGYFNHCGCCGSAT